MFDLFDSSLTFTQPTAGKVSLRILSLAQQWLLSFSIWGATRQILTLITVEYTTHDVSFVSWAVSRQKQTNLMWQTNICSGSVLRMTRSYWIRHAHGGCGPVGLFLLQKRKWRRLTLWIRSLVHNSGSCLSIHTHITIFQVEKVALPQKDTES